MGFVTSVIKQTQTLDTLPKIKPTAIILPMNHFHLKLSTKAWKGNFLENLQRGLHRKADHLQGNSLEVLCTGSTKYLIRKFP